MTWFKALKTRVGVGKGSESPPVDVLTCDEVLDLLYEYIDQELEEGTRTRVRDHLEYGDCECQRVLLFELSFLRKVRGMPDEQLPEELTARVLQAFGTGEEGAG